MARPESFPSWFVAGKVSFASYPIIELFGPIIQRRFHSKIVQEISSPLSRGAMASKTAHLNSQDKSSVLFAGFE